MLNIVIPMAGRGSRFAEAGYVLPKPLILVDGKPMIELVTNNIRPICEHRFIYICQEEHLKKYKLKNELERMSPGCEIVSIDHITEGAACTVLLAKHFIDNDDSLMIANSDQFVDTDVNVYLEKLGKNDGLIMTMPANHPKWSYIRFDEDNYVTEVKEKEVISNEATVGIYNYLHGKDFVKYAEQMIKKDIRVNNEFYVAPVYNEMIDAKKKIVFFNVGEKMHGLGTPDDLELFLHREK